MKKIKDLTLEECVKICSKSDCLDCPFHKDDVSSIFISYTVASCFLRQYPTSIDKDFLEKEIENE